MRPLSSSDPVAPPRLEDFLDAVALDGRSRAMLVRGDTLALAQRRVAALALHGVRAIVVEPVRDPRSLIEGLVRALRRPASNGRVAVATLVDPLLSIVAPFVLGADHAAMAPLLDPGALDERPALAGKLLVGRFAQALHARFPQASIELVAALLG
jgi:hypothetical protein